MAQTKAELLSSQAVPHQQAIVDLMTPTAAKQKKIVIPGGATSIQHMSEKTLQKAVYTWLRGVSSFSECRISLAEDPDSMQLARLKHRDLTTNAAG